ncbi:hypothetical protein H9P43_007510 [Blastocladiella emersonii ATCC 22665]|nr:hypothetical protein H9P43_007510 [Blastocladiella emersonii ATCC 22665]
MSLAPSSSYDPTDPFDDASTNTGLRGRMFMRRRSTLTADKLVQFTRTKTAAGRRRSSSASNAAAMAAAAAAAAAAWGPATSARGLVQRAQWLVRVLWLFTKTDIHNLVLPGCTMNLVVHSLYPVASAATVAASVAKSFLWGYLGLLVIDVTNQLMGQAEDRMNKPFRPIVAGHISVSAAMRLAVLSTMAFITVAHFLGVPLCALSFAAATATYNFTGADRHWLGKNLCNAWGYGCFFAAGAWIAVADVAAVAGTTVPATTGYGVVPALVALHAATILATITIQDLRDVDGDLHSRRTTQNLAWGEWRSRVVIAAGMFIATAVGATRVWPTLGTAALQLVSASTVDPILAAAAAPVVWTPLRSAYYVVLSALVAVVGYRILRDTPSYDVVADPDALDVYAVVADDDPLMVSQWTDLEAAAKRLGITDAPPATPSVAVNEAKPAADPLNDSGVGSYDITSPRTSYDASSLAALSDIPSSTGESNEGLNMENAALEAIRGPLVRKLKRAQYERDDVSFKLYIAWLYLYIFTAVL